MSLNLLSIKMTLPIEIEKIHSAFSRAFSAFNAIYDDTTPYVSGITTTLSFLPFNFAKHDLFM